MLFESDPSYQLLRLLINILGAIGMIASTTVFKPALKRNLFLLSAYIGYCIILCIFVIHMSGLLPLLRIAPFAISIPGILIYYLVSDASLSRHIFTAATQLLISSYVAVSVTLFNIRSNGTPLINILSLAFAYLVIIVLECFFLRRVFLNMASAIAQGWGVLSLIPCALLLFALTIAFYPVHYTESVSSVVLFYALGIVIIIVYCAVFSYLKSSCSLSMKERNREILDLQIQNIRKNADDTKRKAEMAKRIRQDTYALMSGIAALAKDGDTEAILACVNQAAAKNNTAAPTAYCSDPILNATLNSYFGRAERAGITLETSLSIPKVLPVDSAEFSICLANALENAINACEKLPENKRKIIVRCTHNPKLMFRIENTYRGKITFSRDGLPESSAAGHGIGSRSILAFCEKYGALYTCKAEDGWFQITVAL